MISCAKFQASSRTASGLLVDQPLGRDDRDVRARRQPPLLERAAVGDPLDVGRTEVEEAQQRAALGRRAVAADALALGPQPRERRVELALEPVHALGEGMPGLRLEQLAIGFLGQDARHRLVGPPLADALNEYAQLAVVDRQPLGRGDLHAVPGEQALHRAQRPVGHVLVVDGVERQLLEDVEQVVRLDHERATRRQRGVDPGHEVVQVRDVRERVGGRDHRCRSPALHDLACGLGAEEAGVAVDARARGVRGQVDGRVDAERADAVPREALQQRGVVGADVDDQVALAELAAADDDVGQLVQVLAQRVRGRRHVQVVLEHEVGRHQLAELDVGARVAPRHPQRERRLGLSSDLVGQQELVGERGAAEIEERLRQLGATHDAVAGRW